MPNTRLDISKDQGKTVVIGLDGVPYTLLMHYMDAGIMPHFKEMASTGRLMPMKSTLPEVSSVAWTSFMTGKRPADHGVFGFMDLDRTSYEYIFPNFTSLRVPTFWESPDTPTAAINIPQTYPAKKMNGICISGFVAVDFEKSVYPRKVYDYLKNIGYRLDVDNTLAVKNPEAFFDDLFHVFEKRAEAMTHLMESEAWNTFIGVVTETDRLHHFFYDCALEGKYHDIFKRFYSRLDDFIRCMYQKAMDENARFITCSDHGFATIDQEVYVNRLLVEKGFLHLSSQSGMTGVQPETRAFCLDPARVYVHRSGEFSRGRVTPEAYDDIRKEIRDLFDALTFNGEKVVREVYFKEDAFVGQYSDEAPDLYILGNTGFDMKSVVNRDAVFGLSAFKGAHTYENAHLFLSGFDHDQQPEDISLWDIAGLIQARTAR